MNPRLVLVPVVVLAAAAAMWLLRPPAAPAATWRIGTGADLRQGRNYDELPADSPVRLSLHLDATSHVYVFSHSLEDGTLLLFPSPDVQSDLAQPLPAGHVVLPGRRNGTELAWTTRTGILATTTFVVVVAREPLATLEALRPRLRRWTNTARTDGSMQVTNPPGDQPPLGGPRQPLPDPLLQRAADRSHAETLVNGPLAPDGTLDGVWHGSWRVKERTAPAAGR